MLTQRTNPHFKNRVIPSPAAPPTPPTPPPPIAAAAAAVPKPPRGDIIYGAENIAEYLFTPKGELLPGEETKYLMRARRRVYHLAEHYRKRNEDAGFFKLKGALCLSLSQWARFHGWKA